MAEDKNKQKEAELQEEQLDDVTGGGVITETDSWRPS